MTMGAIPSTASSPKTAEMPNCPTTLSPQVCLKMLPERLTASMGPKPSNTSTGTTKKVSRFQAMPAIPERIEPSHPDLSRTA